MNQTILEHSFDSFIPPVLATFGNKTFVMPGWIRVPNNTTLEDVHSRWKKRVPKNTEPEINKNIQISESVKSSKGDKEYLVTFRNGMWDCTCPGFSFRRKCRHTKELKEKHL